MNDFLKTWEGTRVENKWGRVANGALAVAVLILAYAVFNKDQIIVIKPETLGSEAWLTRSAASESYKEAWGLFFAELTGNITPENVDFLKERIKPLLSPSIFIEVIDALETQAQNIKQDRIVMRFEPRQVEYEKTTDKVFVYGYGYTKGSAGGEERDERTYEYKIKISNYAPMIMDMTTYKGKPRSEAVLERMDQLEKQEKLKQRGMNNE